MVPSLGNWESMHWGPPGKTEKGKTGKVGEGTFFAFFEHDLKFGYMAIPCSNNRLQ